MYGIYCKLRDSKGCKDADVAKATGITKSTFSDWKSGRSNPKDAKLQKIADYFGVSLEYLMTGKSESASNDLPYYLNDETKAIAQEIFENPDMRSLFDMSRKMTPERLKAHLEFMKKMQDLDEPE